MRSNRSRRVIKLCDYTETLYQNCTLFESSGPIYVVEPIFESYENKMLNEGLAKGLAKDALQYAVSAAAEYGLAATGGGAPAAPAVESVIDSLFAVEEVSSTVLAVKNIASNSGAYSKILNSIIDAAKNCVSDPVRYYRTVHATVQEGILFMADPGGKWRSLHTNKTTGNLGFTEDELANMSPDQLTALGNSSRNVYPKMQDIFGKLDGISEEMKKVLSELIDKLVDGLSSGIKVLIPDATVGLAVSTAIRTTLNAAAQNPYDTLTGAVKKLPSNFKQYLENPERTRKTIGEICDFLVKVCNFFSKKLEDASTLKMVGVGAATGLLPGAVNALVIKKFGPAGFKKMADFITKNKSTLMNLIVTIIKVIIPAAYGVMAAFQILMNGEYKEDEVKEAEASGKKFDWDKKKEMLQGENPMMNVRSEGKRNEIDIRQWQKLAGIKL